jgi:hypothetical protein
MTVETGDALSASVLEANGWTMVDSTTNPDTERWEDDNNTAIRLCVNRETSGDNVNVTTGHCGTYVSVPPVKQISIGK